MPSDRCRVPQFSTSHIIYKDAVFTHQGPQPTDLESNLVGPKINLVSLNQHFLKIRAEQKRKHQNSQECYDLCDNMLSTVFELFEDKLLNNVTT